MLVSMRLVELFVFVNVWCVSEAMIRMANESTRYMTVVSLGKRFFLNRDRIKRNRFKILSTRGNKMKTIVR